MFVVIGSTTADLLVLSQEPLANPGGEGFQRMNIACPRSTLERALQMLEQAVSELS